MRARPAVVALAALTSWASATAPAAAQGAELRVSTAAAPETVSVGEPFTSMLRVMAPPGSRVEFRGVPIADSVQPVDTVRVVGAASDSGATAAYRLVAWVAAPVRAVASVTVVLPDSSAARYAVQLAAPVVRSVLPAGETPPPRPARGVAPMPDGRSIWPWLAAALLLALAATLLARRRDRPVEVASSADPRATALAALVALDGLGDPRAVHEAAARILRRYLAASHPGWGEEWTSSELVGRVRVAPEMGPDATSALARLLARADRVKFAGYSPPAPLSAEFVSEVRDWVVAHPAGSRAAAPLEAA